MVRRYLSIIQNPEKTIIIGELKGMTTNLDEIARQKQDEKLVAVVQIQSGEKSIF